MAAESSALCASSVSADAVLFEVERELDWLTTLSPTGNAERWQAFSDSGFRTLQPLSYAPVALDLPRLRKRVQALVVENIEHPVIRSLLTEKRNEVLQQVDLLEQIGTDGFIVTSIALFGGSDPSLLQVAKHILHAVLPNEPDASLPQPRADCCSVMSAACALRDWYADQAEDFHFPIQIVDDLDSVLVVRQGSLCINRHLTLPTARVAPLLAHEVGVHVLTRYNGRQQPLRLFESGLANYDVLQEGLATLAEYVTGYLPARRLRELAARVVAADLAVNRHSPETIFATLHEEYDHSASEAFDIAVRASRGGGFTKDAVYLKGLQEVLAYLRTGEQLEPLLIGKIALEHRQQVDALLADEVLLPPAVLPHWFIGDSASKRLSTAARTPVESLFHRHPGTALN